MSEFDRLMDAAKQGDLAEVKSALKSHAKVINQRDQTGATALHYAAFGGHRSVVKELVRQGADINARDGQFDATPAGWAIEYMREMSGFLAIELDDFAYAIGRSEIEWVTRFLHRFPSLREASDPQGKPFKLLAQESGNKEIADLFA